MSGCTGCTLPQGADTANVCMHASPTAASTQILGDTPSANKPIACSTKHGECGWPRRCHSSNAKRSAAAAHVCRVVSCIHATNALVHNYLQSTHTCTHSCAQYARCTRECDSAGSQCRLISSLPTCPGVVRQHPCARPSTKHPPLPPRTQPESNNHNRQNQQAQLPKAPASCFPCITQGTPRCGDNQLCVYAKHACTHGK